MSQEDGTSSGGRPANPPPGSRAILAETRYLRLVQEDHWTYVQRPNIAGALAIVAVTEEDELLLVDQYRIPVHRRVIELPAGLVGDSDHLADETLEQAAARELWEEVGYEATAIHPVDQCVSSAGLSDEMVHLLVAHGVRQVGRGGGVGTEDILVCHVPLKDVDRWLAQQQREGKYVDYKVFAGLYYLLAERSGGFAAF